MNDEEYDELRCISAKKHSIKNIQYNTCGASLGAAPKNRSVDQIHRCSQCGKWILFTRKNPDDILHCKVLERRHYNFSQPIRTVEQ